MVGISGPGQLPRSSVEVVGQGNVGRLPEGLHPAMVDNHDPIATFQGCHDDRHVDLTHLRHPLQRRPPGPPFARRVSVRPSIDGLRPLTAVP
jgi:hypothetical protein